LKGLPTGQRDLGADRLQLFQDADLLDRLEVVGTVVMFGFGSQAVQLGYERRDVRTRTEICGRSVHGKARCQSARSRAPRAMAIA